jgi:protease-4
MPVRVFLAAVIFLISAGRLTAEESPLRPPVLPYGSVSTSDDIWSLMYNPAGLGISRGMQFYYLHSFNAGSFEGNNAILASLWKTGLAIEWLGIGSEITYRKYTLAQGISLSKKFHLGASYSWFGSGNQEYDRLSTWSLGLLARPAEYISYGFRAGDLNHPTFLGSSEPVKFVYGVALRPATDRITLAVEGMTHENQSFFADADFWFKAEFELAAGLFIQAQADHKKDNLFLGAKINLPNLSLGSFNWFRGRQDLQQGVTYVGLSGHRHRTVLQKRNNFLVMDLGGDLPEEARQGVFKTNQRTFREVLEAIQKGKKDNAVTGLVIVINPLGTGLAKIQELREALKDFKADQKNVIAFIETGTTKEYYLAAVADRIWMLPSGYLDFTGLSAQVTFLKGTLDKLGIEAELEHIGKYKTASELLTRDSMSEAHQEVVNSVLDDLFAQMTKEIATDRGWGDELVREKIDWGPFTAREALQAGLVDRLAYPDEIEEIIGETPRKKLSLFGSRPGLISEKQYLNRRYYQHSWKVPPRIAVIYVTGLITPGGSSGGLLLGNTVGANTIANSIRQARNDRSIKAIVLRVDSGGGSGLASEIIWRELKETRKKKPVVVSMSDAAASGGYFVSIPGEEILASPATLTGSIGVIAGKFNLAGLYEKIGLNIQTKKRGQQADFFTSARGFSEPEREILVRQITEFYDDFVGKVAEARNLDTSYVDSIARGRVWTGRQAKENRLADRLGGFLDAIRLAKSKAGIDADQEVEIAALPRYRSLLPFGLGQASAFSSDLEEVRNLLEGKSALENDRIFYLSPYQIKID